MCFALFKMVPGAFHVKNPFLNGVKIRQYFSESFTLFTMLHECVPVQTSFQSLILTIQKHLNFFLKKDCSDISTQKAKIIFSMSF